MKKNGIPILYIEAKDIGVSLDKIEKSEQMKRYFGYANLVLTDYTEFRFYRNGIQYDQSIKIADYDIKSRTISALPDNYEYVAKTLLDFAQSHKEPIKSGKHLSKIMGGKAQRIRDNVKQFLATESDKNTELVRVHDAIKKLLVHDLTHEKFADMYAQTLVYGLFVARYHDKTLKDFSRGEARDLVPKSNPLLQHFFDHIVGPHFDKRLEYIVDELCVVFSHANVEELMKEYFKDDLWGKTHRGPDPVIHFYEDFLKEYDDELRKKMGAYYTPLPVVQFIVRSVDQILEKDFGLSGGLADTSKNEDGVHKVQILDPAVGTGTFFSSVVGKIYERILKNKQQGTWPTYVHHDLLPRLHGFEIMMTPYTIAHLKMAMAFEKTGFKYFNQRLGIYLTNALDQGEKQEDLLSFGFAESIAEESKKASAIKNDTPIMVVVGNPPYSGESSNTFYSGHDVYKVEPGGKEKLKEKNPKWLNDDYVKFLRFSESMVERNEEGVVAMITAHGYIDNPTFRGMRWHLRKTFDTIYVLDLHGNTNKKEAAPDGGKDENVFNIKTGVSIIFGVKKSSNTAPTSPSLATVYQADFWGTRASKFDRLNDADIQSIKWNMLSDDTDVWRAESEGKDDYLQGFSVTECFPDSTVGIVTSRDAFVIDHDRAVLSNRVQNFLRLTEAEAKSNYALRENKSWKIAKAQQHEYEEKNIARITYRPFDMQYIYYHNDFIERSRMKLMKSLLESDNIGLVFARSQKNPEWNAIFVTENITETKLGEASTQSAVAPLYIYSEDGTKNPNLDKEIWQKINSLVGETEPEDILDYIYAFLHSPNYREKYKEFLKIDFPRVPYPEDKKQFESLVKLGKELRELHLLTSPKLNQLITSYPEAGSNEVENISYKDGNVSINDEQYFGDVPEIAWNFYIGGYQPAQKWLKDRKGRSLTSEDISHYQKMIVALVETDRIMKEIDKII